MFLIRRGKPVKSREKTLEEKLKEIVGKQAEVVVTSIKTANGVLKDIRHKAIEEGITISEIVTKALKDYLEKEKKRGK